MSDDYVRQIVTDHTPNAQTLVDNTITALTPHIHAWANGFHYAIKPSGSLAKGTGITGTTDIDLFISLDPSVSKSNTLEHVYQTLRNRLNGAGYSAREQNVSLGIEHNGLKIDVVAGVRQNIFGTDHSIWKRKAKTWTKTNIDKHISHVKTSGRLFDIKAVKIWRKLKNIDFPSFYLELSVIEALKDQPMLFARPSHNFVRVMEYLSTEFINKTITDPANSGNVVSEELSVAEKSLIKQVAEDTLKGTWADAIW